MASKKTTSADSAAPKKARKPRTMKPQHFIARIHGMEEPVVVIATTHKEALKSLVTLTNASADDLMNAGAMNYPKLDTTAKADAPKADVENASDASSADEIPNI